MRLGYDIRVLNLRILLVIAAISFSATPATATQTIAGTKCQVKGQIKTIAKKSFVCTSKGQKSVWVEMVQPKSPASPKNPGPIATPQPTPTPSKSPVTKVVAPISPEITTLGNLVTSKMSSASPSLVTVDFRVSPTQVSKQLGVIAEDGLQSILLLSGALGMKFSKPVTVLVGERDWLIPQLPGNTWCMDPVSGVPGSASAGFCGLESGIIFMSVDGFLTENGRKIERDFTQEKDKLLVSFSFTHEIFHWVQAEAASQYAGSKGFFNPYWLNEGGANFAAMVAQSYLSKKPFSEMRTYITSYANCVMQSEKLEVASYLLNSGQRSNCGAYYAGYLWSEYLVASTGDLGSLINLAKYKSATDSLTWNPNNEQLFSEQRLNALLKAAYGFDLTTFASKAESYENQATNALRNWLQKNS